MLERRVLSPMERRSTPVELTRRQTALVLRREGLSYGRIGERLGVSSTRVRVIVLQALRDEQSANVGG